MQIKLEDIQHQLKNKLFYGILGVYGFIVLMVAFAGYTGYSIYKLWARISEVEAQVSTIKTSATLIRNNKQLIGNSIDELNTTLNKLIPEDESYFLVVSALEQLASKTGVEIQSYSIDLEATNTSTLSLEVEIAGTPENLKNFYQNYLYSGGRLITSEKVELSEINSGKITFTMNFYHNKYQDGYQADVQQLSPKDIELVQDIQSKL